MQNLKSILSEVINFTPARLYGTNSDVWYIGFRAFDPHTKKLKLVRVKINRIENKKERKKYADILITQLNAKLASGWSPFVEASNKSRLTLLSAIELYLNRRLPELASSSVRSYRCYISLLQQFTKKKYPSLYLDEFSRHHANEFMDFVRFRPNTSARTFNNSLIIYKAFMNWFVDRGDLENNSFQKIKRLKEPEGKNRTYIPRSELRRLVDLLQKENPEYLFACMLIYFCFLRPADLACLRYSSFDFQRNLLKINGNETKNKHTSYRVLPKILEKYFCFSNSVSDDPYLFSHNQLFTPGHKKIDSREFARYWNNFIRKNLGFPMEYKLYSLKDTGITNMLADGVPPIFVQGQADHSSIDITSIYTHNQTPEGFDILREVRDI